MRNIFIVGILSCFLFACNYSAEELADSLNIGNDFVNTQAGLAIIDTFTIQCSTLKFDSLISSAQSTGLVGKHNDLSIGEVNSSTYFRVSYGGKPTEEEFDVLDSLMLYLIPNKYYYGDTTGSQNIKIYRLEEEIDFSEESTYLYNNTSFKKGQLLADFYYHPEPLTGDTLEIQLSQDFAKELYNLYKSKSEIVEDAAQFDDWFKGIYIEAGEYSNCIMGYNMAESAAYMRLYYHDNGDAEEKRHLSYSLFETNKQFNHIETNYLVDELNKIDDWEYSIPETDTDNLTYIQAGMGVFTKLKFPSLKSMLEISDKASIVQAVLKLKPLNTSYANMDLAPQLVLYKTDDRNNIGDAILKADNSGVQTAALTIDKEYNENTIYQFDITSYLLEEFADDYFSEDHALMVGISTDRLYTTLDRVVLYGNRKGFEPELTIYYVKH